MLPPGTKRSSKPRRNIDGDETVYQGSTWGQTDVIRTSKGTVPANQIPRPVSGGAKRKAGGKGGGGSGGGSGGKRKAVGGGSGGGGKCPAGGAKRKAGGTGASASTGGGRADGNGNGNGADPMEVSGDDMSRATFGGGGGGTGSDGGNDGDDGGGDPSSSGGSGGTGGNSDDGGSGSDDSDSGSDDSHSGSEDSDSGGSGGRGRGRGGRGGGRCGRGRGGGDRGGRGGRGRGGRRRVLSTKCDAVRQRKCRSRRAKGKMTPSSTKIGNWLIEPVLPCLGRFLSANRKLAGERAEDHVGTATRADPKSAGAKTVADLANPISLLSDSSDNAFEVFDDIFFPRANMDLLRQKEKKVSEGDKPVYKLMKGLKKRYDLDYVFDPTDIDVVIGQTVVQGVNVRGKVMAFKSGEYIIQGSKGVQERVKQWDLLENRIGNGVTLEQDLARYIRQLAGAHTITVGQIVPFISADDKLMTDGMLLDVDGGLSRAKSSSDGTDSTSGLPLRKLDAIKAKMDKVRHFSLKIFTNACVQDLLPNPGTISCEDAARDFIGTPGSLKRLNFMPRLECFKQKRSEVGHLFTGKVVRGGANWVPRSENKLGSWETKLSTLIVLVMGAYRLRRPTNLIEAFVPLSPTELHVLKAGHSFWDKNMDAAFDGDACLGSDA